MRKASIAVAVLFALALSVGAAWAAGITLNTSTRLEIISCASGGSADAGSGLGNTLAEGTYLFRVTGEDTWLCYAASCAAGGEKFPNNTLMLLAVPHSGQAFSCHSTNGTGTISFTLVN